MAASTPKNAFKAGNTPKEWEVRDAVVTPCPAYSPFPPHQEMNEHEEK